MITYFLWTVLNVVEPSGHQYVKLVGVDEYETQQLCDAKVKEKRVELRFVQEIVDAQGNKTIQWLIDAYCSPFIRPE